MDEFMNLIMLNLLPSYDTLYLSKYILDVQ